MRRAEALVPTPGGRHRPPGGGAHGTAQCTNTAVTHGIAPGAVWFGGGAASGAVWFGAVWFGRGAASGAVWFGAVWFGAVWFGRGAASGAGLHR
ncbi:hypothetical protein ACFSL4_03855 [Streptomyces caeni]|uniref:Uncharacterized protein n=1 Tax=Streptomyces caeni TaxID=2307231 RepID=A0ABW4IJA4_9ACTN